MILYFSGTGNSKFAAERIAAVTGDETVSINDRMRAGDTSALRSETPFIVVAPTYCWRMPRAVSDHLSATPLEGSSKIYYVLTCGADIGNSEAYLKQLTEEKKMEYMGCAQVVMPDNYIVLYEPSPEDKANEKIKKAAVTLKVAAEKMAAGQELEAVPVTGSGTFMSGFVNNFFVKHEVKDKKFKVSKDCTSCGLCESLCPMLNIKLTDGKPVWQGSCIHCMACIAHCPAEAINYGGKTKKRRRYVFPDNVNWLLKQVDTAEDAEETAE